MFVRAFLEHQINVLVESYDVSIITNLKRDRHMLENLQSKVHILDLPIEREIRLFSDLRTLFILILILQKGKFALVHSASPKAGLITAIAAWVARIPNRLHTFTGQVWSTKRGFSRWFLILLDKIIVLLDTNILVDSFSQQDFLIKESVLLKKSSLVLGSGSISGVDTNRFQPSRIYRKLIRNKFNIKDECIVFLFVGRLKKEKGVLELFKAFKNVSEQKDNVALFIVGPDEEELKQELIKQLGQRRDLVEFIDFTETPEQFMAASDIFLLPSYREGFGSVVIEAASCGLPSIGSNIYGLSDAIKSKKTGFLIPAGSSESLKEAMLELIDNSELRNKMGLNARRLAIDSFSQDDITLGILELYKELTKE